MTIPETQDAAKSRRDRATRLRRMLIMPVLVLGIGLWLSDAYSGRKVDHERFAVSRVRELATQYWTKRIVSPGTLPTTAAIAPIDPNLAQWLVARWDAADPVHGGGTIVVEPIQSPPAAVAGVAVTLRVVFPGDTPIEIDADVIDGIVHVLAVRDAPVPATTDGAPPLPGAAPAGSATEP
ncbi:MAG: hypothetical protein FJ270_02965 [Planctomycetes bacterium]|nr:hypothetical protein [Planctomycetota bacterium]